MNKVKIKLAILSIIPLLLMSSCSNATRAKLSAWGGNQKVELYSGGVLVKTWTSQGYVESEGQSDGYVFKDLATGDLIRVSGDIVVTNFKK